MTINGYQSQCVIHFSNSARKEDNKMKKGWIVPPECCIIIEMEHGASLGYRKAVLLNEINALRSLGKDAKTSGMEKKHARDLILEMNEDYSQPLAIFLGNPIECDQVQLTQKGAS
jgi:hypothetical protein